MINILTFTMAEELGEASDFLLPENIKEEIEDHDYPENEVFICETKVSVDDCKLNENIKTENTDEGDDAVGAGVNIENVKTEFVNDSLLCDNCNEEYQDYCIKCGMLEHILNRNVPHSNKQEDPNNEIPKNMVEIKTLHERLGVFALKIIPGGVKFGPFTGVSITESPLRMKQGKFLANCNKPISLNWMQHINCAKNVSEQNLSAFEYRGDLYYRSIHPICEGDELLVYFGEKYVENLDNDMEVDCFPGTENDVKSVFACTYCCLGFSAKLYLLEHKTTCRNGANNEKILTEVLTQCQFCEIYLDEREYLEYHRNCCSKNESQCVLTTTDDYKIKLEEWPSPSVKVKRYRPTIHKCTECSYRSIYKADVRSHFIEHYNMKLYRLEDRRTILKRRKARMAKLQTRSKYDYSYRPETHYPLDIDHKCLQCLSELRIQLENRINGEGGEETEFKCSECDYKTSSRSSFEVHVEIMHNCESVCNGLESKLGSTNEAVQNSM